MKQVEGKEPQKQTKNWQVRRNTSEAERTFQESAWKPSWSRWQTSPKVN